MQSIKVSVIIPLYNGKDKIIKCLWNLANQTFKEPYEVIIIDDCSTDDSASVVEREIGKVGYSNFQLIRNKQNGRAGKARNTGVSLAKGEYILFVDQDDYPDYTLLEELYRLTDNGFYDYTYCNILDRNQKEYSREVLGEKKDLSEKEKILIMHRFGYVLAILIRKRILTDNGLCFPEQVMFEDVLYNFGVVACSSSVNATSKVLYYRTDDEQSQTGSLSKRKLEDRLKATEFYLDKYRKMSVLLPYLKVIDEYAFYYVYLSNVWWMIMDSTLYSKQLFKSSLSIGRSLQVSWKSVKKSQKQLKPIAMSILKVVYYFPFTLVIFRCLGRAYRLLRICL